MPDPLAPPSSGKPPRKLRADAARNRLRLLEVAKAAFVEQGGEVYLDEIARRAGVGIGTLYRHFPTRTDILSAVYLHEIEQLALTADGLLATHKPIEALRAWMRLFIDYVVTKKIILAALSSVPGATAELMGSGGSRVKDTVALLADRAKAAGELRPEIDTMELLYAVIGFVNISTGSGAGPGWEGGAQRLIDILIAGSRTGTAA